MSGGSKAKQPAAKAKRASGRGRDWDLVRARFVASGLTTREFAAAEGISYSMVSKRAAADGWVAEKVKSSARVVANVTKVLEARRTRDESEIDGDAHDGAGEAFRKAREMIAACESPQEVKAAVEAMEKAYRLQRLAGRMTLEPVVATPEAQHPLDSGDVVVRRRHSTPDGSEVSVEVGDGSDAQGGR